MSPNTIGERLDAVTAERDELRARVAELETEQARVNKRRGELIVGYERVLQAYRELDNWEDFIERGIAGDSGHKTHIRRLFSGLRASHHSLTLKYEGVKRKNSRLGRHIAKLIADGRRRKDDNNALKARVAELEEWRRRAKSALLPSRMLSIGGLENVAEVRINSDTYRALIQDEEAQP